MVVGKLIIIPALRHQNKGKWSFTGSGLFVLMSQGGNNNELAPHHVPCDRLSQKAYFFSDVVCQMATWKFQIRASNFLRRQRQREPAAVNINFIWKPFVSSKRKDKSPILYHVTNTYDRPKSSTLKWGEVFAEAAIVAS